MARALPVLVIAAVVVLVFAGLALAWRARRRGQAELPALAAPPADAGATLWAGEGLYVATTRADAPLDRIAVGGLAFRARASIVVTTAGIRLDLAGADTVFIPASVLAGAGRATWTIDRVVEPEGLAFVRWRLGDLEVDSSVRVDAPGDLVAAVERITHPTVQEAAS